MTPKASPIISARGLMSSALVMSAVLVPSAVILATPAWAAGCAVFSNTPSPVPGGVSVTGTGGRSGCTNTVNVTVELKKDQFGPDPVLGRRQGNYRNVSLSPDGKCSNGTSIYFVEVNTNSGQYSAGPRTNITC